MWFWVFLLLEVQSRVEAFCPSMCHCEEAYPTVECEDAELGVVPGLLNPNLKRMNLAHNVIKSINDVLGYYEQLEELNLSRNSLLSIGRENFKVQKKLKELNLSFNNITTLESNAFQGLRILSLLDVSHNYISTISPEALSHVPNLRVLILSKNRLHALSQITFKSLSSLIVLDLCDNFFRKIPSKALGHLENLENLLLCRNRLTHIREYELTGQNLKLVSLSSNSISVIDANAFYNISQLKSLNLNDNVLQEVPSTAFEHLKTLNSLDISRNKITTLADNVFVSLKNVINLQISQCHLLEVVEPFSLHGLDSLETLILSKNPLLQQLPLHFLPDESTVITVDLRNNGLTTLSEKSFPLNRLKSLELRENPLVCNCSLLWLGTLLNQKNRTIDISDVKCNSPDKLKGVYLSRVTSNDLLCVDTFLEVIVGVTVICLSSLLIAGLFFLICRYRRRPHLDKLSGNCGWVEGPLRNMEPWSPDPAPHHCNHITTMNHPPNPLHQHHPSTTHIISDDFLYHTFSTLRKVPVTEV